MIEGSAQSPLAAEITAALTRLAKLDPRLLGVAVGGSAVVGTTDEFSDLDFVIICDDEAQAQALGEAQSLAADLGPLLAAFTGEHVRLGGSVARAAPGQTTVVRAARR